VGYGIWNEMGSRISWYGMVGVGVKFERSRTATHESGFRNEIRDKEKDGKDGEKKEEICIFSFR
jgi:hypothetical protein